MAEICESPKYYRAGDLRRLLGVTAPTLWAWTKLGLIPGVVRIGSTNLFEKEAFDKFIKDGGMAR